MDMLISRRESECAIEVAGGRFVVRGGSRLWM